MSNASLPLVSVVMTVYNAGEFVGKAIKSIQNQTYDNWELIVVNDGSTDKTKEIVNKIAKKDQRITMVSYASNKGASYASNLGLSKARGKLIARMDADDISDKDRLSSQVEFLLDNPDVVVVGGQCELIDRQGKRIEDKNFPLEHEEIYEALCQYNSVQHPTIMVNTKLLGKRKIIYRSDVVLAHDLDLLFFLAQYGKLANLPQIVLKYQIHNDSLSLRDPKQTFRDTLIVRERAVQQYGYKPSWKGVVVGILQRVIVGLLPSVVIYPLFHVIRMRQVSKAKALVVSRGRYTAQRVQYGWAGVNAAIAAWVVK